MTLRPRKEGETLSSKRMTPAEMYVRSLDGEFFLLSEVADQVGVAAQTLRRLVKSPEKKIKAPSYIGNQGKMEIYLFTPEDVEEIRAHYQSRYEGFEQRDAERGRGRPKSKKAG